MNEDIKFLRQASEALHVTFSNEKLVDPKIQEIISRLKREDVQKYFELDLDTSLDPDAASSSSSRTSVFSRNPQFEIPRDVLLLNTKTTAAKSSGNSKNASKDKNSGKTISKDKSLQCVHCGMTFRRSSDVRRHERAHLRVLPHICKECGKGFSRKDALRRHSGTLTCERNKEKLLNACGNVDGIIVKRENTDASVKPK